MMGLWGAKFGRIGRDRTGERDRGACLSPRLVSSYFPLSPQLSSPFPTWSRTSSTAKDSALQRLAEARNGEATLRAETETLQRELTALQQQAKRPPEKSDPPSGVALLMHGGTDAGECVQLDALSREKDAMEQRQVRVRDVGLTNGW